MPLEVRQLAWLKRRWAKNDRLDAQLIAAATVQVDAVRAAQDPRLADLAERLTAYEQITDQAAQLKTFMEHVTLKDIATRLRTQIRVLDRLKAKLATEIVQQIKAQPDLIARFRLLVSDARRSGPIVAATLVVRMPELGQMRRGQPASLIGVAPFDRDSGQYKGLRFIAGGRARPRRMLYLAALAAKAVHDPPPGKALADQLLAPRKADRQAGHRRRVMRKLIEAANLVLARGQPWLRQLPT